MFKFLEDIKDLKAHVYQYNKFSWSEHRLVDRVNDLEDKFDALLTHLNLTTDFTKYTPEVPSKLIIRKRTKKDDEPKRLSLIDSLFGLGSC